MSSPALKVLCALTACAVSMTATAQVTYRCGNSYSQTPCPDAVIINTDDKRTSEQKAQADLATQRDAKTANAMEKARLQQEARDLAANTPALKASSPASASKGRTDKAKNKKKTTHKAPDQGGKKAPLHPASAQKEAGKS